MLDFLISCSFAKGIQIEIDPERIRPLDADLQVPDTNKFKNHTGWEPEISFEKTMIDLLSYWREKIVGDNPFLMR
jgi:GDPmannose 4,6-dehydratase